MDNQQITSKSHKSESQRSDNKSIVIGSIVATLIAITPYLFYLYESVPQTQVWDTFFGVYNSGAYQNAYVAMWSLTGKLIPLFLLFIWFFTCRHWWFHVLIVPIAMYAYQAFGILNDDLTFVDSNQLMYLVPIMAVIIPSIYLIRARIFNRMNKKTMQELEDEFRIGSKGFIGKLKDYF
jgi:hypothetical protein